MLVVVAPANRAAVLYPALSFVVSFCSLIAVVRPAIMFGLVPSLMGGRKPDFTKEAIGAFVP